MDRISMTHKISKGDSTTTVSVNGKPVTVVWTRRVAQKLAERSRPLVLEIDLYFSCLVKKFVHVHDQPPQRATIPVTDKLQMVFRVVTSTVCTMDLAEALGHQPVIELDTAAARSLAPKRLHLDFAKGQWVAAFWV
jgi:hypothetical protein